MLHALTSTGNMNGVAECSGGCIVVNDETSVPFMCRRNNPDGVTWWGAACMSQTCSWS